MSDTSNRERTWALLSGAISVALVIIGIALLVFARLRANSFDAIVGLISIGGGGVSILRARARLAANPGSTVTAPKAPAQLATIPLVVVVLSRYRPMISAALAVGGSLFVVGFTLALTPLGAVCVLAGAALFGLAYARVTPITGELPAIPDLWDRTMQWIVEHGALPALMLITAFSGLLYNNIFNGETTGDDLTFHMAESRRLADCIRDGDWDFWNPSGNAGYASAYYYQVIPQLASALPAALFGDHLFWFQATLWLPQVAIPLAAYRGMRLIGATPWQALCAAFAVTFLSGGSRWGSGADGTFWVGLYTQTWALAAFPLALGHAVRWLRSHRGLPSAVAWGAFVFLCHPFASIALCFGLACGTLAHYLQFSWRGTLRVVALAVLAIAIAFVTYLLISDPVPPPKPGVDVDWRPQVKYVMPLIGLVLLAVRVAAAGRAVVITLLVAILIALVANAIGFAVWEGVPKRPEGATQDLPPQWWFGGASLYLGPAILLIAIALRCATAPRRSEALSPKLFVRLLMLGGFLLVATAPGWLTLLVDMDGFGGFPHRVADEVGPGYQELSRWYTRGSLLDNGRFVMLTWSLPVAIVLGRSLFDHWLWPAAIAFAALLVLGPHAPKTANDLFPGVRFLGALQITLALGIGAGLYAAARWAWWLVPSEGLRFGVRTVIIAVALVVGVILAVGGRVPASRVRVLDAYDYADEMRAMNDAIAQLPQGRKQVGDKADNHWWNLLSYVHSRRPALFQLGGGGLQASPNYDFIWSVRDYHKLAWVYDTPLFLYGRASTTTPPDGPVLHATDGYELRRLPAPGPVSAIQVTGFLPEGPIDAKSPVRAAAIEWLRGSDPLSNKHLAYAGYGEVSAPPSATILRAFHVDPSPGDIADIYAEVEVATPTTFVARESWHRRWHAYIDGVEVPVRRVTPDFPAIDVPPGKHILAFRFERPWWAHAAWLLWPACTLAAWLLLRHRRRAAR